MKNMVQYTNFGFIINHNILLFYEQKKICCECLGTFLFLSFAVFMEWLPLGLAVLLAIPIIAGIAPSTLRILISRRPSKSGSDARHSSLKKKYLKRTL